MMIRIGTRKSKLALIQTELVKRKILQVFPDADIQLIEISTEGDRKLDRSLDSFGGKGVFTRELEEALLQERIDLAVHSAKDLPTELPPGLQIGAVPERSDVRDVFVTVSGKCLREMPVGSVVGTSSLRRELQARAINPGIATNVLRGNVETRLEKLKNGQYDGILLAAAGLKRLGLTPCQDKILENLVSVGGFCFEFLDPEIFLPAAGQGILAVEAKEGRMASVLEAIHDPKAWQALLAERSFLKGIGGSCNAPAAACCRRIDTAKETKLRMQVYYAADGQRGVRTEGVLSLTSDTEDCDIQSFGEKMAREVKRIWSI